MPARVQAHISVLIHARIYQYRSTCPRTCPCANICAPEQQIRGIWVTRGVKLGGFGALVVEEGPCLPPSGLARELHLKCEKNVRVNMHGRAYVSCACWHVQMHARVYIRVHVLMVMIDHVHAHVL